MTGFGRGSFEVAERTFEVEVRTVNSRHLDTRVKLPRQMSEQEPLVKSLVQARLKRGKADVTIGLASGSAALGELQVNISVADQYIRAARELAERHGLPDGLGAADVLSMSGVTGFTETGMPQGELVSALTAAVGAALDGVDEMRAREGAALATEFETRLARVISLVAFFDERSEQVIEAAREKLRKRTEQIRQDTGLLDEARLYQEIVIAADRLDVREELVRLRSHVAQFESICAEAEDGVPIGRRLDFLLQEMGREANTVGSKANDAPLAHNVVELKAELERIREQVQNVE
jgi:uncharacterized protein (TIGR00255 family)